MNKQNSYSIYKLTFPDEKIYIGQTCKSVEERWKNGKGYKDQKVYLPIILNGWEQIKKEILHTNLSKNQADELEQYYIKQFNSIENGYNQINKKQGNRNRYLNICFNCDATELILKAPELSKELNGNAFKLLFYFFTYNHQTIHISSCKIEKECGVSNSSFTDSFKELIDKKYIAQINDNEYILLVE